MIIDVSEHQGVIDWERVKSHIAGAMLRAGYGKGNTDKQYLRNVSECNRLKIPCGAYWFSYAYSTEMVAAEAAALLDAVKPYRMELPLAFDLEYESMVYSSMRGVAVAKPLASRMATTFCQSVEDGGYYALLYANPDFLRQYYDATVTERFGVWLAAWGSKKPDDDCQMWQYSNKGRVEGIAGDVDLNEPFLDFPSLIRSARLNCLTESDAVKWARELGITDDAAIAEALWRYHAIFSAEDGKTESGLLS